MTRDWVDQTLDFKRSVEGKSDSRACNMSDGPVCGGFDTFFGHSKGLYNNFENSARRSSSQYDNFFSQAIGMAYDYRRRKLLQSDDTGAS